MAEAKVKAKEKRGCFFIITIRLTTLLSVLSLVLFFFGGLFFANQSLIPVTIFSPATISGRTIVIDAGHGGRDPGAIGRTGLQEKEVNLDIAKRLKRIFARVGVYVLMTREQDIDFGGTGGSKEITSKRRDLIHRIKQVNESKADLLLSIHVNSFPQSIWSGAQCFYDTSNIHSKILAESIQRELVERLGPNRRKAIPADYMILKSTQIPSVTVEVGFISNPREEQLLATAEYREKLAEAIYMGTAAYLSEGGVRESLSPVKPGALSKVFPELPSSPLDPGYARLFFTAPYSEDLELWMEERDLVLTGKENIAAKGRIILNELLKGPGEGSALLPCLPPGEWIREIRVQAQQGVIDLNGEMVTAINGGVASELLALYSLVNTLTLNLELEEVKVLIDGEAGYSLGGHIILDEPVKPRTDLIHTRR